MGPRIREDTRAVYPILPTSSGQTLSGNNENGALWMVVWGLAAFGAGDVSS